MSIPDQPGPRKPKLPVVNRICKALAIVSIIALAISTSCAVGTRTMQSDMKQHIVGDTPNGFPILVFWFENGLNDLNAKAIPMEDLAATRKDHPGLFFTLPDGRGQELHNCLRKQAEGIDSEIAKQYSTGRAMQIVARVESSTQTEQHWRVRFQHGNDHVNIGYYRATKDSVFPTHIERYFGPALAFQSLPYLLAGWAMIWGIAAFGLFALSKIRYFNASMWCAHATS